MQNRHLPDAALITRIKREMSGRGASAVARQYNVDRRTLSRVLKGLPVYGSTLTQLSGKRTTAEDYAASRTAPVLQPPRRDQAAVIWEGISAVRQARDAQLIGRFRLPYELARSFRTDDAIFPARGNRLSAIQAIAGAWTSAGTSRGDDVAKWAARSITLSRATLKSIAVSLLDHGVAIAQIKQTAVDDGKRVDFRIKAWPIKFVEWDPTLEAFKTQVRDGVQGYETITHGDGRWIVFQKSEEEPWAEEATVLPAALIFAIHAYGLRDWAKSSTAHGNAKLIGELGEGVPTVDGDGVLTAEAKAMIEMLQDMINSPDGWAGIRPFGTKVEFASNGSTNWQVFDRLIQSRERAAARVYLGNDGSLGSAGGAPGVDISALFGVTSTILQGDFEALSRGLYSGVSMPWTAINYGDSRLAPTFDFAMPDPDAERRNEQNAKGEERLMTAIKERKANGLVINQDVVNELAARFGVSPAPQLADDGSKGKQYSFLLAPTDIAKVVRGFEARAAQGLDPFGTPEAPDPRDQMTLTEIEEASKAKAAAQAAAVTTPAPGAA